MKVEQIALNQIRVFNGGVESVVSYDKVIVEKRNEGVVLDIKYWNYSKTTSKYLNIFLDCKTVDIKNRIGNGTYILDDLNK